MVSVSGTHLPIAEKPHQYEAAAGVPAIPFAESALVALWLLGRVPAGALPLPVLQPGRAGRGPGPDVREAVLVGPSGVPLTGDVEVHLRASDFVRHGHASDSAYARVVLHLCWLDDRPLEQRGCPTPLPPGSAGRGTALTAALSESMTAGEVERLVRLGPAVSPPCAGVTPDRAVEVVRAEGRRRLAEMSWRAWRLADRYGFAEAFLLLLDRVLAASAGRVRETEARRNTLRLGIINRLGGEPLMALRQLVLAEPRTGAAGRTRLVDAMRVRPWSSPDGTTAGLGEGRGREVAWNAALPLLSALAAAYDDTELARMTAAMAEDWPAPAPYGRTRRLAGAVSGDVSSAGERGRRGHRGGGALFAQGLLHIQDLWCERGGCGVCPLSAPVSPDDRGLES